MRKIVLAVLVLVAVMNGRSYAAGLLIPTDKSLAPMAIKHQRVAIDIKDGVATAKVEQVFQNSTNRVLEAVYIFPLPEGASIADFAMYINGKRESGELVEKGKAREIYQNIVRRMKDPGLLEYMDSNLLRVSVYPVPANGEQKIEIQYSQALEYDTGLYKYVYPLRTTEKASRTLQDFTISAKLRSALPIRSVYSPSHEVGISRKSDHEAVIGFEEEKSLLDRDFVLYYGVSKKDFGLNLLTHAPNGDDGYFMMMLSPTVTPKKGVVADKDITFVFDTSGSMMGKKIQQAKSALEYCVTQLNPGDRFNVIQFNTDLDLFRDDLVDANEENKQAGIKYARRLKPQGGTNMCDALLKALAMEHQKGRPHLMVFLTDGLPTVGETKVDSIVSAVKERNKGDVRIFVFGVGQSVNTHLLDRISGGNGGASQYVGPEEDIETKVSSLSDKVSNPVLGTPAISVDGVTLKQMHPRMLPDLFCGEQITVFGRYQGEGHVAIRLSGMVNGQRREYVYEGTFSRKSTDNDFIPRLWGTRRVGYLLDEIRLNGEKAELKNEVIRLSKEHGIMTPYTSYLVLENDQAYGQHGITRTNVGEPLASARPAKVSKRMWAENDRSVEAKNEALPVFGLEDAAMSAVGIPGGGVRQGAKEKKDMEEYFRDESGMDAVDLSKAIREYKELSVAGSKLANMKHVGKKTFFRINGVWVDSDYKKGMKETKVSFGSDEYFDLLIGKPELKRYLSLGEKVIVCLNAKMAIIVE